MQPIVNVDVTTVFYACPATFRKKDFRDRQQLFHMWKSAQQVFKERMAFQRALKTGTRPADLSLPSVQSLVQCFIYAIPSSFGRI
jgi:hypothetical protein